jgi:guanosine-3',5'-bis(diphosphate) 3'-pyrophosphohydrolase
MQEIQALYQKAILFAASRHEKINQKVPGTDLPYLIHLSNVVMEILIAAPETENFNLGLAVQVAQLHDTLEDTATEYEELVEIFGSEVANGVKALTKNKDLPKDYAMIDSLARIKSQPKEIWAVKLADRITNLQPPPPHWDESKKLKYLEEAQIIYQELKDGNQYLADRLYHKIDEYRKFCENIITGK